MKAEQFLDTTQLSERLTEVGLNGHRVKVFRWIKLGMPVHRPTGPSGKPYFLWSEVDAWIKSKWFDRPPGEGDGDQPVEATG